MSIQTSHLHFVKTNPWSDVAVLDEAKTTSCLGDRHYCVRRATGPTITTEELGHGEVSMDVGPRVHDLEVGEGLPVEADPHHKRGCGGLGVWVDEALGHLSTPPACPQRSWRSWGLASWPAWGGVQYSRCPWPEGTWPRMG